MWGRSLMVTFFSFVQITHLRSSTVLNDQVLRLSVRMRIRMEIQAISTFLIHEMHIGRSFQNTYSHMKNKGISSGLKFGSHQVAMQWWLYTYQVTKNWGLIAEIGLQMQIATQAMYLSTSHKCLPCHVIIILLQYISTDFWI